MTWKQWFFGAISAGLLITATPALSQTLASNSQPMGNTTARYFGQSFLVSIAGSFNNIQFSFRDAADGNVANGTLYIFNSECTACRPDNLSQSGGTASMVASGNVFTFDPSFTLTGGQTYYAYGDTAMNVAYGGDNYPGGAAYTRPATPGGASSAFGSPQAADTAFIV